MRSIIYTILFVCLAQLGHTQTASDYYLPLCKDNFLKYECPQGPGGWGARSILVRIVRAELIKGQTFYYERAVETMSPTDSNNYRGFWLNTDAAGNVLMGAYDTTQNGILANAVILPFPVPFFSNDFLTLGYARRYELQGPEMTATDSTISTTANVGSYSNCLVVRSIRKINGVVDRIEDTYYAKYAGIVKVDRTQPFSESHTSGLVNLLAIKCSGSGTSELNKNTMQVSIYPNPARDHIRIELKPSSGKNTFTLYDVRGQKVTENNFIESTFSLSVAGIPKGMYLFLIEGEGGTKTGKLLIE